jgi:hypothetical protein
MSAAGGSAGPGNQGLFQLPGHAPVADCSLLITPAVLNAALTLHL